MTSIKAADGGTTARLKCIAGTNPTRPRAATVNGIGFTCVSGNEIVVEMGVVEFYDDAAVDHGDGVIIFASHINLVGLRVHCQGVWMRPDGYGGRGVGSAVDYGDIVVAIVCYVNFVRSLI